MLLQTVYFIVGVAGVVLAVLFACAAIIYFVKVDIRAVRDDLSGKTRQAGIDQLDGVSNKRKGKGALADGKSWGGEISRSVLKKRVASSTGTASGSMNDSRAVPAIDDERDDSAAVPSGTGYISTQPQVEPLEAAALQSSESADAELAASDYVGESRLCAEAQLPAESKVAKLGFVVTRSVVKIFSRQIISPDGTLARCDATERER